MQVTLSDKEYVPEIKYNTDNMLPLVMSLRKRGH